MGETVHPAVFAKIAETDPDRHRAMCRKGGQIRAANALAAEKARAIQAEINEELRLHHVEMARKEDEAMWRDANYHILAPNPGNPDSSPLKT